VFTVTSQPLTSGWLDRDVGPVGLAGSASYANGAFTINGAGNGIGGTSNWFHFVYQPLTGDGTIVGRVVSSTGASTQAGVMVSETLDGGSANVLTVMSGCSSQRFFYRTVVGQNETGLSQNAACPNWVKVVRTGNTFGGYVSYDGLNWSQIGSQTITMAQNVYVGLMVTSGSTSTLGTATIDNVSLEVAAINGTLTGFVTRSSDGSAISGAQVKALQAGNVRATATTASDGSYSFASLLAGTYDVSASASGLGTSFSSSVGVSAGLVTHLNFSLSSQGSIQGRVTQVDGVTGISGATLQAAVGQSSAAQATTDSNGNYTLPELGAGSYQVQASAADYVPATLSASVTAGGSTSENFSLQASTAVPITYVYDVLGRLVGVTNPFGDTAIYNYDAVGNLLSITRQSSTQLSIIAMNPIRGPVGTTVTIYGTGFSTTPSQNTVQFTGTAAVVQSATATQLVVTVPTGATTGLISVTTSAGTVTSGISFTVGN
jgi:YD repeat-containing protein